MRAFKNCLFCTDKIELLERKDSESWTGSEYAKHITDKHPEKKGPIGVPYAKTVIER
jgi:hypothetical protein